MRGRAPRQTLCRAQGKGLRAFSPQPSTLSPERSDLPARFAAATRAAAIAAVAAAAAETARALRLRPRFIHRQAASAELMIVQLGDRFLRFFIRAHLHECEAARAPGGHIAHHLHRLDGAGLREQVLKIGFPGFVRKVSHVKSATHLSLLCRACDHWSTCWSRRFAGFQEERAYGLVTLERQPRLARPSPTSPV